MNDTDGVTHIFKLSMLVGRVKRLGGQLENIKKHATDIVQQNGTTGVSFANMALLLMDLSDSVEELQHATVDIEGMTPEDWMDVDGKSMAHVFRSEAIEAFAVAGMHAYGADDAQSIQMSRMSLNGISAALAHELPFPEDADEVMVLYARQMMERTESRMAALKDKMLGDSPDTAGTTVN